MHGGELDGRNRWYLVNNAMLDIKRILCPVDFSDASRHAIDQAVVIAKWYAARITALHVYDPIFAPASGLATVGYPVEPPFEAVDSKRLEDEATTWCRSAIPPGIELEILIETGQPAKHILQRAVSLPADLVVMGTHGVGGFQHLVLGSVTEKVLRTARCPVLTVPPRGQATSRLPFKRMVCAVDLSDSSLTGLRSALSLAQEADAELTILHVLEWPWEEPPPPELKGLPPEQAFNLAEFRRYREHQATAQLKTLVPDSTLEWCTPTTRLRHGKPYVEILRVAEEQSADLIVMGVRGRTTVDVTVFGSTTNQVVRRATCPVLTIHG